MTYVYASYHFDFQSHISFLFVFKRTFASVKFFLSLFKTHFLNFVQIVCVVIRVPKFWCLIIWSTYFWCFLLYDFIHCVINGGFFY